MFRVRFELYLFFGWASSDRAGFSGVRLCLCPPHPHILWHPDAGTVAGAVDAGLQILLGDGWNGWLARGLRQFDAAWRLDRIQGPQRLPAVRAVLLLLRPVRVLRLHVAHVGDRAFAVR